MNLVREGLWISRGIFEVAPGKIRGESSSTGSEIAECRLRKKIRAELSSNLYPRDLRSAGFTPHKTSTLSFHQISRWSKREGNFYLRVVSRCLVCCSQCPSSAMLRGRRYLTAASAGSSPGPHSLRSCRAGLRFESSPEGHGLLVDSSGRSIISSRLLLCCISLRKVAARDLRVRKATLRRGVPLRWPDWWTPVGVAGVLDNLFQYRLCRVQVRRRPLEGSGPAPADPRARTVRYCG